MHVEVSDAIGRQSGEDPKQYKREIKVRFVVDAEAGIAFDVYLDNNGILQVRQALGYLLVRPEASNAISIRGTRW